MYKRRGALQFRYFLLTDVWVVTIERTILLVKILYFYA